MFCSVRFYPVMFLQGDLVYEEVYGGVDVLSAVANVNKAVSGPEADLLVALNHPKVHLASVESDNITTYKQDLTAGQQDKQQVSVSLFSIWLDDETCAIFGGRIL